MVTLLARRRVRTDLNLVSHSERAEQKEIHIRVLAAPVFVFDDLGDHQQVFVINVGRRVITEATLKVTGSFHFVNDDPEMLDPLWV
jgi:hypothetical protein